MPPVPARVAVMVDDAAAPFAAQLRGRQLADSAWASLIGNHRLVIVAVERPGLDLLARKLAAVQQLVERMKMVVAHRADGAQLRLELVRRQQTILSLTG